jgi:macrophage erythroblast attacher
MSPNKPFVLCDVFSPLVQAGLVALKNPPSSSSSSREDPLHHPDFQALAAGLPYAKHVHSKLICAVTREIMTDANPPMVLPNGYVYSQKAVEQIAAQNGGKVVCPRTGSTYGLEEARRAFIV